MSLHWTIIAGFLYAEIAAILLLLLPFLSNKTWNKLFRSRFFAGLQGQLIYYFYVLVAILILFFLGKYFQQYVCLVNSIVHGMTNEGRLQMLFERCESTAMRMLPRTATAMEPTSILRCRCT